MTFFSEIKLKLRTNLTIDFKYHKTILFNSSEKKYYLVVERFAKEYYTRYSCLKKRFAVPSVLGKLRISHFHPDSITFTYRKSPTKSV